MSDLDDDSDILEDIKALEDVLAIEKTAEISDNDEDYERPAKRRRTSVCNETIEVEAKTSEELISKAFEINETLIAKYRAAKEAVTARLKECLKKQEELDLKIKLVTKGSKGNFFVRYSKAGHPYFKDAKHFPAPLNEDALTKSKRAELMIVYQRSPSRWTVKDRNSLWMAVRLQAATEFFEKETKKQKGGTSTEDSGDKEVEIDLDKCQLPKNYKEMIGPLGSREFDWMKIAAQGFNNRHSADECRVMWNVYLHPDINRYKFSTAEDKSLKRLVECHNFEDWEAIAKDLGSGRSGYQCFIRYTTIVGPIHFKNKDIVWSNEENKILMSVVDDLRIGNYIPWSMVAFYIENRSKQQVYSHWKYNIDPSVRKGRFTVDEDELLLEGVTKFGKDFPRISNELIPHRTSVQLSGRFTLLMLKTDQSYNSWTVAEDMQLLKLFDEVGPQWSRIAEIMKKNRTYVRHRYASISRFLAKGGDLSEMSRKIGSHRNPKEANKIYDHGIVVNNYSNKVASDEDIDTRLRKYFEMVQTPATRPGRQSKYQDSELERHTKGLYELFQKLDVRLEIPDLLKVDGLTVKDKQLLSSYKDYVGGKARKDPKEIERVRIMMFGPDKPDDNSYYVPPAPFGLYLKPYGRKKGKKDPEKTVDEDCVIVLDLEFETPENIIKMLNEEELDRFDKLSRLVSREDSEIKGFERKFITEDIIVADGDNQTSSNEVTMISWGRKVGREINRNNERERTTFVEPCHSTLLGYDTLRYMKETHNHTEWTREEIEMSKRPVTSTGKHAFHLFKTRFTRLFKYPIGMLRNAESKATNPHCVILPSVVCNAPNAGVLNSADATDSDD